MPTGFTTPSGKDLPKRLKEFVDRFASDLKAARDGGRVTPEKRITARELCERYMDEKLKVKMKLSQPDIRSLVSHLRVERQMPIGSGDGGYFWANDASELETTIQHLTDRRNRIGEDVTALKKVCARMASTDDLFTRMKQDLGLEEMRGNQV
jgi:hypothetical protein